jgi:integrase
LNGTSFTFTTARSGQWRTASRSSCQYVATDFLAPNTKRSYRDTLRLHVTPALGAGKLQALTTPDVDRLYARLRDETRLSARTRRYVHVVLRRCLADAVRKNLIVRNPCDQASPPPASAARAPEMKTWNPAEMRGFLEHPVVRGDRLYAAWRLLCMAAVRRGEALGAQWRDLDGNNRLSVRRQVVEVGGKPTVTDVKTPSSRRAIALDGETVAVLAQHRRRQLEERLALGGGYRDDGFMFAELDGTPIAPSRLTKRFQQLVRESCAPRIRLHDVRHSAATHLIASGAHAKAVSSRLGHSSSSFTLDKYGHVLEGLDADAAAAVAALVDGAR